MNTHGYDDGTQNMYDQCRKHMNYHVMATMRDGNTFDGIIEDVGMDNVSMLVGEEVMDNENDDDDRQFYGGYGRPRRRYRRFRRRNFPLAALASLALLPYIVPPPYPYYPYPYPYY